MAETLKFGPEWLRALSDGTSVTSPPPSPAVVTTTYKLADHRYGREEMLALFAETREVPEELNEVPAIVSEKPLQPLALIPLSTEEQKLMTQSVNSLLALRMMGRGNSLPPGGLRGGRGGMERGRGRGRGRGEGYYMRGFDDDPGYGRGRVPRDGWEEGRGGRYERSYPPTRSFEDEVVPPPHREFSRSMSSENWRESKREEEDENDWRRAPTRERWGPRNWREPRERFDGFEGKSRHDDSRDRPPYDRNRFQRTHSVGSWEDGDLPEWSTEDVEGMEGLGTFDSNGAFMSIKQMEESSSQEQSRVNGREGKKSDNHNVKEKSGRIAESPGKERESKGNSGNKEREKNGFRESVDTSNKSDRRKTSKDVQNSKMESKKDDTDVSQDIKVKNGVKQTSLSRDIEVRSQDSIAKPQLDLSVVKPVHSDVTVNVSQPGRNELAASDKDIGNQMDRKAEEASSSPATVTIDMATVAHKVDSDKPEEDDANFDHLAKAAENLVATLGVEEEKEVPASGTQSEPSNALSLDQEDAKKWFYRDPQGDLQGPFMSSEMAEWFSAGYFTMNLMVKRGCDERFQPLGELIKSWGRIPFIPGNSPPPLKVSPDAASIPELSSVPLMTPAPQIGLSAAAVAGFPAAVPSVTPTVGLASPVDNPEQLKALQHQMVLQQQLVQQQLLRQMQCQQILQQLQKRAEFANLPLAQQQRHAYELLLQQQMMLMQQQSQPVVTQQQQQHLQQKPSPRAIGKTETLPHALSQPVQAEAPGFQRSMSQPGTDDVAESIWGLGIPVSSGASAPPSWTQPRTVWDVDLSKAQTVEELQRHEVERIKREQEELEANQQRLEEERRNNEERKKKEIEERERIEREKQERLEREKQEKLEREKLKALERQREMERRLEQLAREEEEKRRQQQLEEQRKQEEEKRRMKEKERRKEEKLRLLEQEEQMKKELEEKKRQEEIKRRQQQAQHQEALRQLSREQLSNIQLPATAQWGSSPNAMTSGGGHTQSGTLSLTQIQQMEAERERKEQEELQRKLELQRQLMNAMQQQKQQLQGISWASKTQSGPVSAGAPSLLEIQQEQARQLKENSSKAHVAKQPTVAPATTAVWGGTPAQSSNWAQEGAWGNPKTKATLGFWDDAVSTPQASSVQRVESSQKKGILSSSNFPSLSSSQTTNGCRPATSRSKPKSNKDEETVQRLFQNLKPKDEFTQWCENALQGIQSNVDIPTFVAFLIEVESPYEVQDYARSYLGETRETTEFARQFLEKRSKYKNQLRQQQQAEDGIWGPAAAINPGETRSQANHIQNNSTSMDDSKNSKKKKKRMQKLDQKCLGFTVHAAPDRHNIGEIETGKVE